MKRFALKTTIIVATFVLLFAKPAIVVNVNALADCVIYKDACGHMFSTTYNGLSVGDEVVLLMDGNDTVSPYDDTIKSLKRNGKHVNF